MKLKIYIGICILWFSNTDLSGQTLKSFMSSAQEALESKDYYNAMNWYKSALEFDTTQLEIVNNYAEAAANFDAYNTAETQYAYLTENDSEKKYPLAVYHLASAQQYLGKYDEARRNYELYISENDGENDYYVTKSRMEIDAIDWAKEKLNDPIPGTAIERLGDDINSPYSDFGAVLVEDKFYYSSLRFTEDDEYLEGRLYSQILTDEQSPNTQNNVESKGKDDEIAVHEAHTAFSKDMSKMYYTLCEYANNRDIRCDIYYKKRTEAGNYINPIKLPQTINNPTSTNTQPNIGYEFSSGQEFLYFVSNREGGKGDLDIWISEINGDNYSQPENLSSINTLEDEVTPFFHSNSNTLYFSSEGYMGLGGFDVYSSYKVDNSYSEPENMLASTNSSFNDIYYLLDDEGTKGFLSSNRTGSLYLEESFEACCYDIYKADIEEVTIPLEALVFDITNETGLNGSRIRVYDLITGVLLFDNLNSLSNDHNFDLRCNREYQIITDRNGYDSDTTSLSTKNCNKLTPITKKIYLTPQEAILEVYTFDRQNMAALGGASVTLYDVTNPESEPQVIELNENNKFLFDVITGRKYKLVTTKTGYLAQELEFIATDFNDGKIIQRIYFEKDTFDLNEYLPVIVYFDNDKPNSRSKSLFSENSYSETYHPYYSRKQEFKNRYTKAISGDMKDVEASNLEGFFEDEVRDGFERLQLFIDRLLDRLVAGEQIELSLKGFASPRANKKYNLALGQRRIWTIKNELKQFGGGALNPFIESGKLQIVELSYGEEVAPTGISDSYENERLSIYSLEASRQRKSEVVRVRLLNK